MRIFEPSPRRGPSHGRPPPRASRAASLAVAPILVLGGGSIAASAATTPTSLAPSSSAAAAAFPAATQSDVPTPEEFFGFKMGAEGKLAAFPEVLKYMKLIADRSDRVQYEPVGKTTMGNEYASFVISSPENLANLDQILETNRKLSDPRNTSPEEARALAAQSVPVHYIEATVHSTEVGNGQAINDIIYRLATEDSDFTQRVLGNSVVVLVPSQNPDGQRLVVDYFNETAGTDYERVYPDLYHKYAGHDDNRDWTMFTQVESRYRLSLMKKYHPAVVHIMHQQGNRGERIFVPPYGGISSENVPLNMVRSSNAYGQHAARALSAAGQSGVDSDSYDVFWTLEQPVGYFPFMGAAVFLTEIASVTDLAYPQVSEDGGPLGPQQRTSMFDPYDKSTWALADIVAYAETATYAALDYTADNAADLQYDNLYAVPHQYLTEGVSSGSYAYVVDADQRDPYATYEMLQRLEWTGVEIDQASTPFTVDGQRYAAGSWVIRLEQPLGNWADQVLGTDDYPEVRDCSTCPVQLPYAEATTSLPIQLGVDVVEAKQPFTADLERVDTVELPDVTMPPAPGRKGAYLVTPESYGVVQIVTALQDARIPTFRSAESFRKQGESYPAGTYVVPATPQARNVLKKTSSTVGIQVAAVNRAPKKTGLQLKPRTSVGLIRGANNMPGGWDMWLFDEYGINYDVVGAQDFQHKSLNDLYDTIVVSSGVSKERIVEGLKAEDYPVEFSQFYGVGEKGWKKLKRFVRHGGTLLSIGSSVDRTARELVNLPLEPVLPNDRDKWFTGGSLLKQNFDTNNPVAWGMRESWPVWLYRTQAYDVSGPGSKRAEVVSSYPSSGEVLASGYLRGEDYIRGAANVVSTKVGQGKIVTYGSEITFRTLPRSQFNLLFNPMYNGPAAPVDAGGMKALKKQFAPNGTLLKGSAKK